MKDKGKQIGVAVATREIKRAKMKSTAGAFKGSKLDRDELWQDVFKKRSRNTAISLFASSWFVNIFEPLAL